MKFHGVTRRKLNNLRALVGFPIIITSGYRCEAYNKHIGATQTHATGQAVDIRIRGKRAHEVLNGALELGFTGVGVSQKGSARFLHLDDLSEDTQRPRPYLWSY